MEEVEAYNCPPKCFLSILLRSGLHFAVSLHDICPYMVTHGASFDDVNSASRDVQLPINAST